MVGKTSKTVPKPEAREQASTPQQDPQGLSASLLVRLQRFLWDIGGVVVLAFALMTLLALALPDLTRGVLLSWWARFLWIWFGWGALWIVLAIGVVGYLILRQRHAKVSTTAVKISWGRLFALEAAAITSLALLAALGGTSLERADAGMDGGRIGWGLSYLLGLLLAPFGLSYTIIQILILSILLFLFLFVGLGLVTPFFIWAQRKVHDERTSGEVDALAESGVSVAPIQGQESATALIAGTRKKRQALPPEYRKKFRLEPDDDTAPNTPPVPRDERLPPLELLVNEQSLRPDERDINMTAGLIEKTLAEFGITAKVVGFRVGPTVTQFALEPGFVEKTAGNGESEAARQKVRVSQISALGRDLALALSAERLRIEAPVPGRPYVGIEVPNARTSVVRLRPILETETFYRLNSPLAIALGRDVSGQPVVADLTRMPHLLIAGTTGSGKSVCVSALTACLVMNNTPEDLRLIMIDPKMVELVRFNGMPHLYGKVETNLERILGVLRWTVAEMDRRYRLLEASHSRNLESYNRKARRRKGEEPLPRIVVLIDELADLMMSAPEQTEPALVRLAQMARATGIHLVVATQRPSTDVVTGLIKANFPARISFAVTSSIDSRVILDTTGAESLLGRGDMLFLPPEASAPIRCQGVMVNDTEVEKVITFWQKTVQQEEVEPAPWEELLAEESVLADRDDLIQKAIEVVSETQRASASLLQRRLRIGYPRAARLIDELEELEIIGPAQGGGREREVLIGREDHQIT
jgi:DNA segregation ATPase FtsK/SpoIIIE, S-DNA-T family